MKTVKMLRGAIFLGCLDLTTELASFSPTKIRTENRVLNMSNKVVSKYKIECDAVSSPIHQQQVFTEPPWGPQFCIQCSRTIIKALFIFSDAKTPLRPSQ